jgi:hypothetical protein
LLELGKSLINQCIEVQESTSRVPMAQAKVSRMG